LDILLVYKYKTSINSDSYIIAAGCGFKFPAGSIEDYKVTERKLQIAEMLVDTMTSEGSEQVS
jgi:hypothetical protein